MIRFDPLDMRALDVSDIKEDEHPYYRAKAYAVAVPAHLHVNQESRSIARTYYELSFEEQTRGRPIYIDFKIDTICFFHATAIHAFYGRKMTLVWKNNEKKEKDLEYMRKAEAKIQSLRVTIWNGPHNYFPYWDKRLQRFPNLDKLSYVYLSKKVNDFQRWFRRNLWSGEWEEVFEKN
jgi:hypothetical protein